MIGRLPVRALAQLFELGRKDVVHTERLRQFLGDVDSAAAARVEIHFLEDAQIGVLPANLLFDVIQVLAAINVPIEDRDAGERGGDARIIAGAEGLQGVRCRRRRRRKSCGKGQKWAALSQGGSEYSK